MTFARDLVRRVFALSGAVLLSIPLWSLADVSGARWPIGAFVVFFAVLSAARPPAGLLALALVLPLSFALSVVAGSRMTVEQIAECFVFAFVVGGAVRRVLDGRLFTDSRLARPALAFALVTASSGLCVAVSQFSGVQTALGEIWRAATTYFARPGAADTLQPALHWIEFAALAPLVELAARERPRWRAGALVERLGAMSLVAGRWLLWGLTAIVVALLPWRISTLLAPDVPQVVGAGPEQGEIDGVPYRVADRQSTWTLRAGTRTVAALMRWDPAGARDCRVQIVVKNRPDDEVALRSDVWIPVRFAMPPGVEPSKPPEVEFRVSSPTCTLWVGTVTAKQ